MGLGILNTISVILGIAGLLVFTLYKDEVIQFTYDYLGLLSTTILATNSKLSNV